MPADYASTTTDSDGIRVTFDAMAFLRAQSGLVPTAFGARAGYEAAIDTLAGIMDEHNVPTRATVGPFSLPSLPSPSDPPVDLPTISPQEVLDEIVKGINSAEQMLNAQNFVIASGTVEAQLNLPVAGATVSFHITPKPYN